MDGGECGGGTDEPADGDAANHDAQPAAHPAADDTATAHIKQGAEGVQAGLRVEQGEPGDTESEDRADAAPDLERSASASSFTRQSRLDRVSSLPGTLSLEERCRTAFAEFAQHGLLPGASFDEAFRRAGFKDARSEEVERYLQNFVQERPGVAGSQLREQEFLRILASHDSKCRFLRTARVSSDEWVCNALRGLSHHFTKRTLKNGQCLWFPWSGEPMLSIIIAGNAMLWARQGNAFSRGLVDFPIATLGTNSVIGDDLMPHVASKVVACGPVEVLVISMSEVRSRLGDRFVAAFADKIAAQTRLVAVQMGTHRRVCKRVRMVPALSALPFLPVKNGLKEQVAQAGAKLAKAQQDEREAMKQKRAQKLRAGGICDDGSQVGDRSCPLSRMVRLERTGRLSSSESVVLGATRRSLAARRPKTSGIPPRIPRSEYRVRIDCGTMMYDDLV